MSASSKNFPVSSRHAASTSEVPIKRNRNLCGPSTTSTISRLPNHGRRSSSEKSLRQGIASSRRLDAHSSANVRNCGVVITGIGIWLGTYMDHQRSFGPIGVLSRGRTVWAATRSGDFEGRVNLYRNAKWQLCHADGGSRMLPGIAEDFDHEVGNPIRNLRLVGESGRGIHKYIQFDTTFHTIEIAERRLQLCHNVLAAQARCLLSVLDLVLLAQLPLVLELAVPDRDLSGDEGLVAGDDDRHVVRDRCGGLGQIDLQVCETSGDFSGHGQGPDLEKSRRSIAASPAANPDLNDRIRHARAVLGATGRKHVYAHLG